MKHIKNYTSEVPVETTISRIEKCLVDAGAAGIQKTYTNGRIDSVMFTLEVGGPKPVTIRLPSNADKCTEALWQDYKKATQRQRRKREDFIEQGERTAWKLQQDWVEVQVTLIALNQIEVLQAFLSYLWDGEKDFYTQIKSGGYKALLPERSELHE